ncbi:hypothetical protein C0585_00235 [Candidatus Woesearchaeota archaeon]|nr:MAG: hypothetical protein C0585_00235 [Candidatus Woesearchaeota archaeon]
MSDVKFLYEQVNRLKEEIDEQKVGRLFLLKFAELSNDTKYSKRLRSKQHRKEEIAKKGIIHELTSYFNNISDNYNTLDEEIERIQSTEKFIFPFKRIIDEAKNEDIIDAIDKSLDEYILDSEQQDFKRQKSDKLYSLLVDNLSDTIYN